MPEYSLYKNRAEIGCAFSLCFLHSIISFRNSSSKANNTVIQGFLRVFFKDHGNGISDISSQ